ncbi:hypothetical protein [Entomomonas asaccharolytica]|nr:hypothetical protein [Entomomonas asaccharolytica]
MRNCDCNKKAEEKLREKTGDPDERSKAIKTENYFYVVSSRY